MTDEELRAADALEQSAVQANRADIIEEARSHQAEYQSLPLIIGAAIPLMIFGSLLLTMLGLTSKWWYLALVGIPVLLFYFYPLILLDRLRTPLRLSGGEMVSGWKRRKILIGFAAAAMLWMFRFEIFDWLERLWIAAQTGW